MILFLSLLLAALFIGTIVPLVILIVYLVRHRVRDGSPVSQMREVLLWTTVAKALFFLLLTVFIVIGVFHVTVPILVSSLLLELAALSLTIADWWAFVILRRLTK